MQQSAVGFELSVQQKLVLDLPADAPSATAQIALRLAGQLDVGRLSTALFTIAERHEILRTGYVRNPGMRYPVQVVNPRPRVEWTETDVNGQEEATQIRAISSAMESVPFSLDKPPALYCQLLKLAPSESVLVTQFPVLSADCATLHNFVAELSELYHDPAAALDQVLQYADYAQWQFDEFEGARKDRGAAEGRREAAAEVPKAGIPFARRSEDVSRPGNLTLAIPLAAGALEQLHRSGLDPAAASLTLWEILLGRVNRHSRFALGFVNSGRDHDEFNSAFGLFSSIVPIVAELDPEQSFFVYAQAIAERMQETAGLQISFGSPSPFASLPAVGFSTPPAFIDRTSAGVKISVIEYSEGTSSFDLELRCRTKDGNISLELAYNPLRLWADGAQRIAKAFSALLASALAEPQTPVGALSIIDFEDALCLQTGTNQTARSFPDTRCIHHLFEEQASRVPDRIALRCDRHELTYADLNQRANQLAHLLRRRGVKQNVPVGLCTGRSIEMIIGMLAILKAGGCYLPLLPDQPKARLAAQISLANSPIVLTEKMHSDLFAGSNADVVCLGGEHEEFLAESSSNPQPLAAPGDLVYIIYTSGSTGLPKGVAIRHQSLVNYADFIAQRVGAYKAEEPLKFATVSTIGADLGNTCVFPALISGGCLHVVPYEIATSAELFSEYSRRCPVDVLKITPSHLTALLNASKGGDLWPRKFLFLGGEALTWDLLRRIREATSCSVVNHYGPTEATVGCCTFDAGTNDMDAWTPATVPVGRPIANTEVHILDERFRTVPIGVAGELCVGGVGLAQGYVNQPEQTAASFIPHPFSKEPAARLYRTGDLARLLPDGNIEFLGRIDHQVKIRGFRVEPAEIQAAVETHPNVRQAVVLPYSEAGESFLAAYIVFRSQTSTAEMRAFLLHLLPDYMCPSYFVPMEELPLNRNGKINSEALAAARQRATAQTSEPEAGKPRNPEEAKLASIWSDVLKKPCLDIHANFFALGGHSLLATQIVSRIRDVFKVQFPLHSLLQTPTIAELAPKIAEYAPIEEDQSMEHFLATLENLSDEEAEQLLAELEGRA